MNVETKKPNTTIRLESSYAEVLCSKDFYPKDEARREVLFRVEDSELNRFCKAYVGLMENPGISYNIHEIFNTARYFSAL